MSGILLLHKPRHMSSNTAVNIVKRAVGASKAGHLGTLDVEAEGLLVVTLDRATKLFDMFLEKDKTYLTTFYFGEERDTFDLEGKVTRTDDKLITRQQIEAVIPSLIGETLQLPPEYSAKKVAGKKAYELARAGKSFELRPKQVTIHSIKLVEEKSRNLFTFEISCSSGTFIRAICRDMAALLSTCAECYDIIRTRCGGFMLTDAYSLEDVKAGKAKIISPENLFDYPKISLSKDELSRLQNGQFLPSEMPEGSYKLYESSFIGIGRVKEGKLKLELRLD